MSKDKKALDQFISETIGGINEAIGLNELDESMFTGFGIRYSLRSSKKLLQIKKNVESFKNFKCKQ